MTDNNLIRRFFLRLKFKMFFAALAVLILTGIFIFSISPPGDFPVGKIENINSGDSLQKISELLKNDNVIRSTFVFQSAVIALGGEKKVVAGDYLLDRRESSISLAYRMISGNFGIEQIKLTIPEGWNNREIADYLATRFPKFDKKTFLDLAKGYEGYLFPDTYFISSRNSIKPEYVISMMRRNFDEKISEIPKTAISGRPLSDIVRMASIVEEEARTTENRKIVAGILWKRISLGMPLQVDSTLTYVLGKTSAELTMSDLKTDSLYNTYVHTGLPPTPIDNPGLDAISATIFPTDTPYLYFLSSKDGSTMYYGKTLAEHVANKRKYLK